MIINKKRLSKQTIGIFSVLLSLLLACVITFTLLYATPVCSPVKATVVYPHENVVVVVTSHPDDGTQDCTTFFLDDNPSHYVYPDTNKSIDDYDNVVSVDSPTANQVIVRETYPVTIDGVTVMHEIIVWGNGNSISRPIETTAYNK